MFSPGVAVAVLVTVPPAKVGSNGAVMRRMTLPPGARVRATPAGGPLPDAGVAVVPDPMVTVVHLAAARSSCGGSGSSRVAWAACWSLRLVTVTR